jgi:hypothetical protein
VAREVVAPSQISFLTENAIQFRRGVTGGIQEQLDVSQRKSTRGFNVWFNGDVSWLKLNQRNACETRRPVFPNSVYFMSCSFLSSRDKTSPVRMRSLQRRECDARGGAGLP